MVEVHPRQFCKIANPVVKDEDGLPVTDDHGVYVLKYGE